MTDLEGYMEAGQTGSEWDETKPIKGKYTHKKEGVGVHSSNVYIIQTETDTFSVWGSTVLDTKFQEIPIGSDVYIEFLGKTKGKTGTEYKDYKVLYKVNPIEAVFPGASEA